MDHRSLDLTNIAVTGTSVTSRSQNTPSLSALEIDSRNLGWDRRNVSIESGLSSVRSLVKAWVNISHGRRQMEVQITQVEGVKFTVQARNHSVTCDQPQAGGGTDAGMTPPEFLLASLGSCAAFYAAEYLRTRDIANCGVRVSVSADKFKGPARIDNFRIRVDCPICLTAEQREGLMRSVEHCLVKNTLLNPPLIEVSLEMPCLAATGA